MITIRIRHPLFGAADPRTPVPEFVNVTRRGDVYDLGGERLEIFRIRVLAEAVHRDVRTLNRWERLRLLPLPLFYGDGSKHRRYGSAQILNANRLARFHFCDRRHIVESKMRPFFEALRACWYQPEVLPVSSFVSSPLQA